MKRFVSIIALLLLLSLPGCDLDDYKPVDNYSDVTEGVEESVDGDKAAFKDKQAVTSHITTIYNQFRDRQEHWYLDKLLISEAHSDNAYAGTTGAEVVPFETNAIEGSNTVLARDWQRFLEDVARANVLIEGIDSVDDPSLSSSEKARMVAEAKIFRAYIWFDMVRLWGDIPLITTVAGEITSETIEEVYPAYFPAQSSEEEVYKQIEKDLMDALATESLPNNSPLDKTRMTKAVAKALLAKVYAEKPIRNYSKVIQYANELEREGYRLNDNYGDLWELNSDVTDLAQRNTPESILEAQFFPGSGNWASWMFGRDLINWDSNFTWAKWVTPSRDLIRAFSSEGDNVRAEQSVVYYEATWSNYYPSSNYPFMYKLRSANSSIIKLRFADILLLKAEALIMGDNPNFDEALGIINQVRKRADLEPLPASTTGSRDSLLEAYLKERRLELAFEGERWYDLVRLDQVEKVMNGLNSRDEGRLAQRSVYNETSYRLPIPQSAIDQNENLVQNPGY